MIVWQFHEFERIHYMVFIVCLFGDEFIDVVDHMIYQFESHFPL